MFVLSVPLGSVSSDLGLTLTQDHSVALCVFFIEYSERHIIYNKNSSWLSHISTEAGFAFSTSH